MLIASEVRAAGTWDAALGADSVVLDFDSRHRRRHAMAGRAGTAFLLDLPQATVLREGDGLLLDDGRIVRVQAAPERLAEITAADADALLRIAWHLGNRHLPTQLLGKRLRIRHDHVIIGMVEGLGGKVAEIQAPFDPEGGAFEHGAAHAHAVIHGEHDGLHTHRS
ncbi:urease accessory protein UreE [Ramlibacter tataouinensis]|uniref:urease accessory protein UreE n=1 Tax=Ramlibacter tataouinensis TaxID=94132 RepID=UPI0022F3DF4F|nr:urease accessory protein UreE [Ramlibacter tataouinensis]WBY00570.1 urease accessory protein UreE [Ramlibacter tataouinensis]